MNEGTEIKEKLKKADDILAKTEFVQYAAWREYITLKKQEYFLTTAKKMCECAPRTLNPTIIKEHKEAVFCLFRDYAAGSEELLKIVDKFNDYYAATFDPHNINDYAQFITAIVHGFLLSLMKQPKKKG